MFRMMFRIASIALLALIAGTTSGCGGSSNAPANQPTVTVAAAQPQVWVGLGADYSKSTANEQTREAWRRLILKTLTGLEKRTKIAGIVGWSFSGAGLGSVEQEFMIDKLDTVSRPSNDRRVLRAINDGIVGMQRGGTYEYHPGETNYVDIVKTYNTFLVEHRKDRVILITLTDGGEKGVTASQQQENELQEPLTEMSHQDNLAAHGFGIVFGSQGTMSKNQRVWGPVAKQTTFIGERDYPSSSDRFIRSIRLD